MEWSPQDWSPVLVQAGHALIGALMPEYDPVAKISIVPRGAAGGLTFFSPSEERLESGLYRCVAFFCVRQLSFKALLGLPRLCGFWPPLCMLENCQEGRPADSIISVRDPGSWDSSSLACLAACILGHESSSLSA